MIDIAKQAIRFFVLVILQALVLNQLEIGFSIQFMVTPIFFMLLPFQTSTIVMMLLGFVMGFMIDSISNTFGLHASSLVFIAFIRPIIFKSFAPREGYDVVKMPSIYDMGTNWFVSVFGLILFLHHLWFFTFEIFKFSDTLFILRKALVSLPFSFLISLLLQALFVSTSKNK
ncbi:MAG: hypothetical protein RIT10_917 [Bacteroidota bacterium]|jgi:hypothetical protein